MNAAELHAMIAGIVVGLRKAKELFRQSTDARGGCKMLSVGPACGCCLCLLDLEISRAEHELGKAPEDLGRPAVRQG